MEINNLLILIILTTGMFYAIATRKLTTNGAIAGGILGVIIYLGTGVLGVIMIVAFFILGTFATSFKRNYKRQYGLEELDSGRRTAYQVFANIGIAGSLATLTLLFPERSTLILAMLTASLASATADTLSSEFGNIYGRNFYNIISLKRDKKGLDGVVSIEGSLFGFMGSLIIALIYSFAESFDSFSIYILFSGTIGNLADSILGATLQRKGYLSNNAVNLLNTLLAALSLLLLHCVLTVNC